MQKYAKFQNSYIQRTILEQNKLSDLEYIISNIAIGKKYSDKFISLNNLNKDIKIGDKIEIPLNCIKIKSIKNKSYLYFTK